ncbi:restriction endonuclease subunit S [Metamycoplasma neophronis]|nr:restriction endonuclease subunit S [Metamycoplasma neophronis]
MNRYPQVSAEELESLNKGAGEIALLPSSKNNDWKCKFSQSIFQKVCNGEVITVGRARNANTKYTNGLFISSQNHIIESFDKNILNTKFLYFFIKQKEKQFYSAESTYPMFTKTDFNRIRLFYPRKISEQKIIADIFDFVEILITLHQSY